MKKRYQIDREQAVRQFHKQAEESGQELQLHLPLKEVAAALQQSVGELMRQAGLELMQLIMDNEVRQLAGEHYQRRQAEQPYRWGREQGFLVVDGQKVPIQRPRLRSDDGHEQSLGSYALFRRCEPLDDAVWDKLMLGLSTRNYSQAVREFAAAYGIEKSAVSEHFVRTSREKLRELLERPLDKLKLCVIYIDGIEFKGQHLVAALGVAIDGSKTVLGAAAGSEREHHGGQRIAGGFGRARRRFLGADAVCARRREGADEGGPQARGKAGPDPALSNAQAPQRDRPFAGAIPRIGGPQDGERLCDVKLRGRQGGLGEAASRVAGVESVGGAFARRGERGNADGAPARTRRSAALYAGDDEPDRVGLLGGGPRLRPGEALAGRRSARALGGRGSVAGREKLPAGQRLPALAEITRPARQTVDAASGPGPSGVNYKFWRAARFNGILDILQRFHYL